VSDEPGVTLCVLLWARAGEETALVAYEDAVLALVATHGGRVVQRARTDGAGGAPLEVHLLQFPSEGAFDAYMHDPQRAALASQRDRAIARTEVHRVVLV
jgi:uncharacterized protein (DUF1330 family)